MTIGRRVQLRGLLSGFPKDWKEAAEIAGLEVFAVACLPVGAAFAADSETGIIWAPLDDEGDYGWAAWAGIATITAARHALEIDLSDICTVVSERLGASGLFAASSSA